MKDYKKERLIISMKMIVVMMILGLLLNQKELYLKCKNQTVKKRWNYFKHNSRIS
jgi:hypothetical protein